MYNQCLWKCMDAQKKSKYGLWPPPKHSNIRTDQLWISSVDQRPKAGAFFRCLEGQQTSEPQSNTNWQLGGAWRNIDVYIKLYTLYRSFFQVF